MPPEAPLCHRAPGQHRREGGRGQAAAATARAELPRGTAEPAVTLTLAPAGLLGLSQQQRLCKQQPGRAGACSPARPPPKALASLGGRQGSGSKHPQPRGSLRRPFDRLRQRNQRGSGWEQVLVPQLQSRMWPWAGRAGRAGRAGSPLGARAGALGALRCAGGSRGHAPAGGQGRMRPVLSKPGGCQHQGRTQGYQEAPTGGSQRPEAPQHCPSCRDGAAGSGRATDTRVTAVLLSLRSPWSRWMEANWSTCRSGRGRRHR